jgi:membrane protease YdiL (CAAX protease family)
MVSPQRSEQSSWTARNAWWCVLALILFELTISVGIRILQRSSTCASWLVVNEYAVQNAIKVFRAILWIVTAYWFSGLRSARRFFQHVGLSQQPTLLGWWGAWVGVGIALFDRFGGAKGWTSPHPISHGFYREGGQVLLFFVLYVISVGPFFEEVVLRGFLYRAFRGSYGWVACMLIVICVAVNFHWGAVSGSWFSAGCLISLWLLLCVLREWTGNVWNCVLCHAAYNATQVLIWPIYLAGMVVLLPLCAYRPTRPNDENVDTGQ